MKRHIPMTSRVREYLRYRRSLGAQLRSAGTRLLEFARFADRLGHCGPLTTDLMLQWATRSAQHSRRYQVERLSTVRGFARYLAARDGKSEVPDLRLLGTRHRWRQPHIYTEKQLRELIAAAASLTPTYPLRPHTYATLFGLLASTGLRISEALGLQQGDVDLEAGLLHIRETKFRKSRLVPMHPTVTQVLRRYAACRDRDPASRGSLAFFLGGQGRPLSYSMVHGIFRDLSTQLRWRGNGARPRPRIHDLRHSFACRRLLQWYRQGVDVDHAIASLSTYLGHAKVTYTYWYLTGTPELLAIAGKRFERFAASGGSKP
jgi:integrase